MLTNPPFGGKEEPGIESNFPKHFQTRETAERTATARPSPLGCNSATGRATRRESPESNWQPLLTRTSFRSLRNSQPGAARAPRVVRDVFGDAYTYMKSGQLIRQVVNKIGGIDFNNLAERQHFGNIYEQILNDLQSAGNAGEYYTPRALTSFMAEMIDPKPGETLFDPACGTGGFLTCAIRHVRERYVKRPEDEAKMQASLRAVEKKPLPHLFLALIIRLLKPGGRAAVVLPDGSLFGEGIKTRLKEHLMEECNLHTIVRLPNSVFRPYASIGMNLLFFEKGEPTKDIWFWEHLVPEGQKAYSMTRPIKLEHLADCAAWWGGAEHKDREECDRAWKVSAQEIKARSYNLDIKNPHIEGEDYGDSETLLAELKAAEADVTSVRD